MEIRHIHNEKIARKRVTATHQPSSTSCAQVLHQGPRAAAAGRRDPTPQRYRRMQSHGKTRHSLRMALPHGSSAVRADLTSNELSIEHRRIMLPSIKEQATLGVDRDTRAGMCFLKDNCQYAPLYEKMESDLRRVSISDWHTDKPDAKILPDPGVESRSWHRGSARGMQLANTDERRTIPIATEARRGTNKRSEW